MWPMYNFYTDASPLYVRHLFQLKPYKIQETLKIDSKCLSINKYWATSTIIYRSHALE